MTDWLLIAYLTGVSVSGLVVLFFLRSRMGRTEKKKQARLKRLKEVAAVPTEASGVNRVAHFRKTGRERIHARFTITRWCAYTAVFFTVLIFMLAPMLGSVPVTAISFLVAATTVLLSIAARPFLENLFAGITISFSQFARIGDIVDIDEQYGTIEDITMTHTVVRRWDWVRYVVPNAAMIQRPFINYTVYDNLRWVHVEFHVDYGVDLEDVRQIAEKAPLHSEFYNDTEPPQLWVLDMEKESIRCMLVAWATSPADGWMLSVDIYTELLKQFQKHKISTHTYHYGPSPFTKPKSTMSTTGKNKTDK